MTSKRQRRASPHGQAFLLALIVGLGPGFARSSPESPAESQPDAIFLKAGKLLDVRTGHYLERAGVLIRGGHVKEVGRLSDIQLHVPENATVIDLHDMTVLPGLIDCHTHLMARFAEGPDGYLLGLAEKSQAFRALEGASDARLTLHAGFTTVRDVENEGSGYADVALRDGINQGLVEGPRMLVATRGIAAVGQYNPFGVSGDLTGFPTGAQMISGAEDARRAVREQIGHGADLIKVYADWEYPTLTIDEMRVVVDEAHKAGRKVAAHATTPDGIKNAVAAGVDSIEHGHQADRRALEMMKEKRVFLVPTVGVIDAYLAIHKNDALTPEQRKRRDAFLEKIRQTIQLAMSLGLKMANGFDASTEGMHGRNAQELVSLVSRGVPPLEALRASTLNAAELLGWQDRVGTIEPERYADLIAVHGDPLADIAVLTRVEFVMKGGIVVKDERRR